MSYTNKWGQTVTTDATAEGMIPCSGVDYTIDADEHDVGGVQIDCNAAMPAVAVQADGTTAIPDSLAAASPYNPQYDGSSGTAGGFPNAHQS